MKRLNIAPIFLSLPKAKYRIYEIIKIHSVSATAF